MSEMKKEQVEAIEEAVKALGKAIVCAQCYYYKVPRWAKKFKNVVEQCALGLELKEGECRFFRAKTCSDVK
jgi:hypothetical protein